MKCKMLAIKSNLMAMSNPQKTAVAIKIAVSQTSKMKSITSQRSLIKMKIRAIKPTITSKERENKNSSRYRISPIQIRNNWKSQLWISRSVQSTLVP